MLLPRFLLQLSIIRSIIPTTRVGAGQDRPNISPCLFLRLIRDDHRLHLLLHLTLSTDLPDIETLMIMSTPPPSMHTTQRIHRIASPLAVPHSRMVFLPPPTALSLSITRQNPISLSLSSISFYLHPILRSGLRVVLELTLALFHRTLQYSIYPTYIRHSFIRPQ